MARKNWLERNHERKTFCRKHISFFLSIVPFRNVIAKNKKWNTLNFLEVLNWKANTTKAPLSKFGISRWLFIQKIPKFIPFSFQGPLHLTLHTHTHTHTQRQNTPPHTLMHTRAYSPPAHTLSLSHTHTSTRRNNDSFCVKNNYDNNCIQSMAQRENGSVIFLQVRFAA